MMRKGKIRWAALGAFAAKLGSIALVVVSDPAVIASLAGKVGVSVAVATSIVQAVTKPVVRKDHERR